MLTQAMTTQNTSRRDAVDDRDAAALNSPPTQTPEKSKSPKARSLSDSAPRLEPSPKFREPARMSKDDHTLIASPSTPRRPDFLSRGLSLQMPARGDSHMPSPAHFAARVPLSPQLDSRNTYASASPASLLPRRSRGAEFSRACTNLHHSTLPDASSPDSSPTITQKGIKIPPRKPRSNSMLQESPNVNMHGGWSHGDRTGASSSVGSMNMLGSEDSSSSSDEADPMDPEDNDDPMIMTPQAKTNILFPGIGIGNNGVWSSLFSPGGQPNFASMHRARLRKGRSRKSSSSASGHSSMPSPGPASPPNGKEGYFSREAAMRKAGAGSRRESLSLFANDLHISSGNDSGDEAGALPQTPGVVRRQVTRRGNLLPKSRQFGRIKAELFEEAAPIDSEARREADIIRQVRENDGDVELRSNTAQSSPSLMPAVPGLDGPLEGVPEEDSENGMSLDGTTTKGLFGTFGSLNSNRNSISNGFWGNRVAQTPPPSFPRADSSAISEDMNLDSPTISTTPMDYGSHTGWTSRASTPGPMNPPTAAEAIKKSNKRRRDDDFDEASIKRRAVSPGVSVHNSPVISQSPAQRDNSLWGTTAKAGRDASISGHSTSERSNSGGSMSMTPTLGPKRVGLQGMVDTSDGLMKMSIE
ncbi:hypothetical protein NX059_011417 [Plenodomus lindquistii]|nr:hypothetical protein NX059_011417 [Plenodomus lindquistii]